MDIVKLITSNSSIQNMVLKKFRDMLPAGTKQVIIDLSKAELDFKVLDETTVITDAETFNFYKEFYQKNKNK